MNTYMISYTDFTGYYWNIDWEPRVNQNETVSDTEVDVVIKYLQTATWPSDASATAKRCYDNLVDMVSAKIIENACVSEDHLRRIVTVIESKYINSLLTPKSKMLYERFNECSEAANEDVKSRMRKLLAKIVKNENLYMIKFGADPEWTVYEATGNMKCCICGNPITDKTGHDPYPVRPESWYGEKDNRCCSRCNSQIVFPIRLRYGRHAPNHREELMRMNHDELLAFAPDMGIAI